MIGRLELPDSPKRIRYHAFTREVWNVYDQVRARNGDGQALLPPVAHEL
jgi:hypothetical protein